MILGSPSEFVGIDKLPASPFCLCRGSSRYNRRVATRKGGKSYGHSGFQVGRWQVQPMLNEVREGGTVRRLEPQVMDLLVFLACQEGRVVSRDEIIEGVWEGRFIAEATLTRSIADLRNALGDNRQQPQYIETIAKRGYRLVAAVSGLDRRAEWPAQMDAAGQGRPTLPPEPCLVVLPLTNLGRIRSVFLRRSYRGDHQHPHAPCGTSGDLPHVCVCSARARRRHRRHRAEPRCHLRHRGQRAAGRKPHPDNGAVDPGEQSLPRMERAVPLPPFRRLRDPGRNRGDHRAPSRAHAGRR